jgi:membrane protein implicated in regulation of membrane protease activity
VDGPDENTGPDDGIRRRRQSVETPTAIAVTVLILAPIVALLWVGSYAKATPKLWGFPFFYWYQVLWVFLAAACTYAAYMLLHRRERTGRGERGEDL